ncbi:conjugal transfer protein [Thermobifida halotolerans]|uniref:Conjugal transfer protein n=1 Tax=Thermobifida halotolerans TaxID=483545 RepID=A0AA97M5V7_9ACTN|nr:conjugal transfer protein [Thermobifida halotolerans]UOE21431.1 conjugal transfer protein [Thermobifida halotolerans]
MRRAERSDAAEPSPVVGERPWFAPADSAGVRQVAARVGAWTGLLCGPVALALCWFTTASPPPPAPQATVEEARWAAAGPAGWAEQAVAAYLDGDIDAVRDYFPTVSDADLPDAHAPRPGLRMGVVGVQELAPGYWGVTVAVGAPREEAQAPAVRHFALGVAASGDGWVATGLPSEVAVAVPEAAVPVDYEPRPLPRGPVGETVRAWARAYLLADGELDRYLAPGFSQRPLWPTRYTDLDVDSVTVRSGQEERVEGIPADGAVVEVLARLHATDAEGRAWGLEYALTLTARSGRWEVSALAPAPALTPDTPTNTGASAGGAGVPPAPSTAPTGSALTDTNTSPGF